MSKLAGSKISPLAILITLSLSGFSDASTHSFQATVIARDQPQIAELQNLNFGFIDSNINAVCSLDAQGNTSGNCEANGSNIQTGLLNISGVSENTQIGISISGGASGNLRFTAEGQIPQLSNLAMQDSRQVIVNTPSENLQIEVFGAMEVQDTLTPGATYRVEYTLDVSFQ